LSANSSRVNLLNNNLYNELKNNPTIEIEWHTRWNFKFKQKFSFIMTIDISSLSDKEKFIEDFYTMNNDIVIHWEDVDNINKNINIKNQEFDNEINEEVIVEVESF
jgi:hypothetical protein